MQIHIIARRAVAPFAVFRHIDSGAALLACHGRHSDERNSDSAITIEKAGTMVLRSLGNSGLRDAKGHRR